ncbi:MAG: hypothetical protein WC436_01555 [Candidatus Babeliales bacterium]
MKNIFKIKNFIAILVLGLASLSTNANAMEEAQQQQENIDNFVFEDFREEQIALPQNDEAALTTLDAQAKKFVALARLIGEDQVTRESLNTNRQALSQTLKSSLSITDLQMLQNLLFIKGAQAKKATLEKDLHDKINVASQIQTQIAETFSVARTAQIIQGVKTLEQQLNGINTAIKIASRLLPQAEQQQ